MKQVRLNNGIMMPSIGLGVFQIPRNETERCVSDALEAGYRMIDTASAYFNEKEVGDAVRKSGIKREELFITTKLWVQDYEYDDALRAFDRSMKNLGLDYLDLYLLHKPYGNYYAAWRAVERLYKEGRIRAIGVTSFPDERLLDLMLHNDRRSIKSRPTRSSNRKSPTLFSPKKAFSTRHGLRSRKAKAASSNIRYSKPSHDGTGKVSDRSSCAGSTSATCRDSQDRPQGAND